MSSGAGVTCEGLVVRIEARTWTVELSAGGETRDVPCSLKPRLFETLGRAEKNPVAVGDRVRVRLEGERGVIEEVLPRRNRLARPTPRDADVVQTIAANVDLLVIVAATRDPPLRTGLIDRFLVTAERNDMDALIVVNKVDSGGREEAAEQVAMYEGLGYDTVFTSTTTGEGVAALRSRLAGRTALFVGHSGVGKSSLLNALEPGLGLRVGGVAKHGRGRHTTTSVSLWRVGDGGHVVDSPGVRGFGLSRIPPAELALLMPDLRGHAVDCHYPDCTHDHEPDCAVRRAVDAGMISRGRYESYLRMLAGEDPGDSP